jgi:hypothetical protein
MTIRISSRLKQAVKATPPPAQVAARAKASERYEAFVTALGRRLAQGPKLRQEIAEDIPARDAE